MEKFKDTFKRVYRYRVAKKLLNLLVWILSVLVFAVVFVVIHHR